MTKVFIHVLNMSLTAGITIAAILLMRFLIRKAPKVYSYALWGIALFRLLCPVSFSLPVSVFRLLRAPQGDMGNPQYLSLDTPDITQAEVLESQEPPVNAAQGITERLADMHTPEIRKTIWTSVGTKEFWLFLAMVVWLLGIAGLLAYSIHSLRRLKRQLKDAVLLGDRIYESERIDTPFVLGVIRPCIYLPSSLDSKEMKYVLLHEQTHIKRKDPLIRMLSFGALCLHWFNPLVWTAFFLSDRDMEMSCDEAVILKLGDAVKKDYSQSLLAFATGRHILTASPLAFGEGDTKGRVKNVLSYKKPTLWVLIVCLLICILSAVLLLSNPERKKRSGAKEEAITAEETEALKEPGTGTGEETGTGTSELAESLFAAKNPYVGDGSADGRLLRLLNITEDIGNYTIALKTDEEPYSLTLNFKEGWDAQQENDKNVQMWENAVLLLALIDNLSEVSWSYPCEAIAELSDSAFSTEIIVSYRKQDGKIYAAASVSAEKAGELLTKDIKTYGQSASNVHMLLEELPQSVEQVFGTDSPVQDQSKDAIQSTPQDASQGTQQNMPQDASQGAQQNMPQDVSQGTQQNIPQGTSQNKPQDTSQGTSQNKPQRELLSLSEVEGELTLKVRSVSRSAKCIEWYFGVPSEYSYLSDETGNIYSDLYFAEDCKYYVNSSMNRIEYEETDFDTFADHVKPSRSITTASRYTLFMHDGQIHSIYMLDSYAGDRIHYHYMDVLSGSIGGSLERDYELVGIWQMDVTGDGKAERIEVYNGDPGSGQRGVVVVRNADGRMLYHTTAFTNEHFCQAIYAGIRDGKGYLMTIHTNDRLGDYYYDVFTVNEDGTPNQLAGCRFEWRYDVSHTSDGELLIYRKWLDEMNVYYRGCQFLIDSNDGIIRTDYDATAEKLQ